MRQGYNYIKRLNYVLLDALKLSYNSQNAAELGSVHFLGLFDK